MKKLIIFFLIIFTYSISANNLMLENISLLNQSLGSHTFVEFDISWDNSWKGGTGNGDNWDAAWVFVKYKTASGNWEHATLNSSGHTVPSGATIETSSDGKGIFIYRNANGTGSVDWNDVGLRWNYAADGLADDDDVTVKVFGIEMVYIPEGSFYVGDGEATTLGAHFEDGATGNALQITSEGTLTLGGSGAGSLGNNDGTGNGYGSGDDFDDATSKTLPAAFPKGYDAFYAMKHEVSQQSYTDFLNCLTRTQQDSRVTTNVSSGTTTILASDIYVMNQSPGPSNRNTIRCNTTIPATDPVTFYCDHNFDATGGDGAHIAANFLSWEDSKAFADWAGLRPMTELEFEKACRGSLAPVTGEYAWGSINIKGAPLYTLSNSGLVNESINLSGSTGNASYTLTRPSSEVGPLRCGIFADGSGTRVRSGATYFGVLEMSGNLTEQVVTVSLLDVRSFTGNHGDGDVSTSPGWPTFKGLRGNGYADAASLLRVSDRTYSYINTNPRIKNHGFRAVRTAP